MKRLFFLLILIICIPRAVHAQPFKELENRITSFTLENGMTFVVMENFKLYSSLIIQN